MLGQEKTMSNLMNFNAKKMVKEAKIFNWKLLSKLIYKPINTIWVVTGDYHVIYVQK